MTISTIIQNSAPQYMQLPALLSNSLRDSTLADELVQYLDSNKHGKNVSLLDITSDDNEQGNPVHQPKGIQCNVNHVSEFNNRIMDHLFEIIKLMNVFLPPNSPIEQVHSWGDAIWLRKYVPNLQDKYQNPRIHMDYTENIKDVASISIALNDPNEYQGGDIVISDGFDQYTGQHKFKPLPKLHKGDGIIWNGWTLHGISPLSVGERYVMIVHFQGKLK